MKQIKWNLLVIALLGVILAYANKPAHYFTYHRYAWLCSNMEGSKYYISKDLTNWNWTKGVDYYCATPALICTFLADPMRIHIDATGSWFYVTDVPTSGIDRTGIFQPLNF